MLIHLSFVLHILAVKEMLSMSPTHRMGGLPGTHRRSEPGDPLWHLSIGDPSTIAGFEKGLITSIKLLQGLSIDLF